MSDFFPGEAHRLAAAGRVEEALALLHGSISRGSAAALFELAVWRLRGSEIARDLGEARQLLHIAARGGHADAALLEVALCANGTGAPPDFATALRLLEVAARQDGLALEHLRLLRSMDIDDGGRPCSVSGGISLSERLAIRRIPDLLTQPECQHLISRFEHLLRPSMIVDPRSGRHSLHPVRRSDAATIGPTNETLVVSAINRRIAAATGTHLAQGEPLTLLRYQPGQEFRTHHDALPGEGNQRILTVIVYLNDGYGGGQTTFKAIGLTIAPRAGDAIIFENLDEDGRPHPHARHAGVSVLEGEKWIATRWIRAGALDPWNSGER